eukprot:g44517.t1
MKQAFRKFSQDKSVGRYSWPTYWQKWKPRSKGEVGNSQRWARQSLPALSPGEQILQLLQSLSYSVEELQKEGDNLPPDDDDSWLDISPEELDQMLEEASGRKLLNSARQEEGLDYDLSDVTKNMKAFVSKVSSHEGAEIPRSSATSQVEFDVNSFTGALERILGVESDELDSDDLDEEEDYDLLDSDTESDTKEGKSEEDMSATETLENIRDYMKQMDQELAGTQIGKSFTKITDKVIDSVTTKFFLNLAHYNLFLIGPLFLPFSLFTTSISSKNTSTCLLLGGSDGLDVSEEAEGESGEEDLKVLPVDVDLNLVENLL